MGIVRDNNISVMENLNKQAETNKREAMEAARMATIAAYDAFQKRTWITALIIGASTLFLTFVFSAASVGVSVLLFFVGSFVTGFKLKKDLETLGRLKNLNQRFSNQLDGFR